MAKKYCTQNNGDCNTCGLSNYGRDCNNLHIITEDERGHRKPLSESEKTVSYTIKMPKSLKEKCIKLGSNWVRKILKQAKKEH